MTRTSRALLLVLLVAVLTPYPTGSASASCAAPTLAVTDAGETPPVLTVGAPVQVTGRGYVEGCDDGGGGNVFGCQSPPEPVTPLTGVVLELRQAGRVWQLGAVDAGAGTGSAAEGELGRTTWEVVVPPNVRPGRATLVAEPGERLRVTIAP